MRTRTLTSLLIIGTMAFGFLETVSAQDAQQNDGQNSRRGGRGRSRRGGFGNRGPGQRGPGERRPPTQEERDRMYDHMVDRYMDRMTETYELNDQQQTQVRARLEELKAEQKTFSESRRPQFESLHNEMHQLRDSARNGGQFDEQRAREIGQQMRAMWQDAPLMNRDKVATEVEQLLPADQVEKGKARRAQYEAERRQRFEEMRRQWEQRRQQRDAQAGSDGQDSQDNPWQRRGRRGRPDQQDQQGDQPLDAQSFQVVDGQQEQQPLVEDPIGPWDKYVRDFSRRYKLDGSQQATAQSVLREMHERRVAYEQTHREEYEAANKLQKDDEQKQVLSKLNRPVEGLFGQLKTRLDRIPTSDQRRVAGDRSTTRSTITTTQPAASTTQPAAK